MHEEDASACVGVGCGNAHIASIINVRGPFDGPNAMAFRRSWEGDKERLRETAGIAADA